VKPSSLLISATTVACLTVATLAAQSPQEQPPQSPPAQGAPRQGTPGGPPVRDLPAPTNLKVLPKNSTVVEVRDIMQKWAGSLGVHCENCHVPDSNKVGPDGLPLLNFADDSKPDKQIARIMYTMTQQINADYISKAMDMDKDDEGSPVTCGTCHRGHKMPEDFLIPQEGPPGGPGMPGMPAGPPPGGAPQTN